jgi:hypothetical protein
MKQLLTTLLIGGFSFITSAQQKISEVKPELKATEISQGEKVNYSEAQITQPSMELKTESLDGGVKNKEAILQVREERKVTPKPSELKAAEGPK